MDGYEWNKILGAGAGALGVFMAILIVTEKAYHGAHHHEEPTRFYASDVVEEVEVVEAEPVDFAPLLAAASVADGESIFSRQCASCHKIEPGGSHGTGPALHGIMGAQIAAADGFRYSSALTGLAGQVWDWDSMAGFLERPSAWAPGTRMGFRGFRKPEDIAAVMLYLNANTETPLDPPAEDQALNQ